MAAPDPFTTPAMAAPPGLDSNLIDPVNEYGGVIYAGSVLLVVVPTIFLALRFYVKLVILKEFGISDVCAIVAWAFLVVICAIPFWLVQYGMGLHAWDVSLANMSRFAQVINIQIYTYVFGILFTRIAILRQFADIFVGNCGRNTRWWIIHALILFNILFLTPIFFTIVFQCNPREKIWNPQLPGSCMDEHRIFVATSSVCISDDFLILVLPMFWISKLHAARKRKLGVAAVFAVGLFACMTSVVRLVETIYSFNSEDVTFVFIPVALWSMAEVATPLVIFALPVLPRLFRGSSNQSRSTSQYDSYGHSLQPMSKHTALRSQIGDKDSFDNWGGPKTRVHARPNPPPPAALGSSKPEDRENLNQSYYPEIYRTVRINQTSHLHG